MSPEGADVDFASKLSRETILGRLGATDIDLGRVCRTLGLLRLAVYGPVPELAIGPDGEPWAPDIRVFVTFADEPDIVEVMNRLTAIESVLDGVFNRRVSATSIEIVERAGDRNARDRYLARLVTVFDARQEERDLAGREPATASAETPAKPARRAVDRRFAVRTRTDESGCLVVEIRYGKRASAVVAEAARIRRENTRNRWRGLAAADLDDDEGLLRRYGKFADSARRSRNARELTTASSAGVSVASRPSRVGRKPGARRGDHETVSELRCRNLTGSRRTS